MQKGLVHLLRYVASDTLEKDLDVNVAIDTLLCTNALLLPDLKRKLDLEIMKSVDLESAAFVFNIAYLCDSEDLMNVALSFLIHAEDWRKRIEETLEDEAVIEILTGKIENAK